MKYLGRDSLYPATSQAELDGRGDRLFIRNCGASNPNFVNDSLVGDQWMELHDGDRLSISKVAFTVAYVGYTD